MPYVTPQQMIEFYGEVDLREATNLYDGTAIDVELPRLVSACLGATGIVDGYLIRRFTLPLDNPPEHLKNALQVHAMAIARALLSLSPEEVKTRYDASIAWLELFTNPKDNVAALSEKDGVPGVDPEESSAISIAFEGGRSFWTSTRLSSLGM